MLQVDCRGAWRRSGLTQEAWAQALCLSLDRARELLYKPGELPSLDTFYRMAVLGRYVRINGPAGEYALAPVELVLDPETQELTVLDVPGQLSLFGTPVLVHVPSSVVLRQSPTPQEDRGPRQLSLVV